MPELAEIEKYPMDPGPLVVEEIKLLRGANFFSGGPVVRFRLRLNQYDEVFSDAIPGFYDKLLVVLPSLEEHHCSVGQRGGFLLRLREGTLLGHVMEHVGIELQSLAGIDAGFGKTRQTKSPGVYNVIFRMIDPVAGIYAGKAALNLLNALLEDRAFGLDEVLGRLVEIREARLLGPSTQAIVDEARARKIPVLRLDRHNRVQLGTGRYRKLIQATLTQQTPLLAADTAADKFLTHQILREAGLPTPESALCESPEQALAFAQRLGRPIVLKPAFGNRGKGVSIGLETQEQIRKAFAWALEHDGEVIAQEDLPGGAYRLLVVDYKLVAAARVMPPRLVGDGRRDLRQLLEALNAEEGRAFGDKGRLSLASLDRESLRVLELLGLAPESVPPAGMEIFLKNTGNLSLGGSATDQTDAVHPLNRFIVEKAAKVLGLDVAGVDVVAPDLARPLTQTGGMILELNAAPDFRPHLRPSHGEPRPVQKAFVEMLFPPGAPVAARLLSVTGSRGKSMLAGILVRALRAKGLKTAWAGKDGLLAQGQLLKPGQAERSLNTLNALKDPDAEAVVVETTLEAILEDGLGYELADMGIVLNIAPDKPEYMDYDHIRDAEDVAYAKSVVAEQVAEQGWSLLNADQPLVRDMAQRCYSNRAFFSREGLGKALQKHLWERGRAAMLDQGQIWLLRHHQRLPLCPMPPGLEPWQEEVMLAASLALWLLDFEPESIPQLLPADANTV